MTPLHINNALANLGWAPDNLGVYKSPSGALRVTFTGDMVYLEKQVTFANSTKTPARPNTWVVHKAAHCLRVMLLPDGRLNIGNAVIHNPNRLL